MIDRRTPYSKQRDAAMARAHRDGARYVSLANQYDLTITTVRRLIKAQNKRTQARA